MSNFTQIPGFAGSSFLRPFRDFARTDDRSGRDGGAILLAGEQDVGGQDVGGAAGGGCGVVDGAEPGEAFAVTFLSFGQPGRQLAGGLRGPAAAVAGRSASGRMTMPLPSQESTSTSPPTPAGWRRSVEVGCCACGE